MSVESSWSRIVTWLEQNAPATRSRLNPPAAPDSLAAAAAKFPVAWPSDLREWYSLHDGESMEVLWRCTLAHWGLLSLTDMLSQAEFATSLGPFEEDHEAVNAGEMTFGFLKEFVPIGSDGCGDTLFVDLRPGPMHGCVSEFSPESPIEGSAWPSVALMLEDLANSLEQGTACSGWIPSIEDGELSWDLEDAE